jgi:hypothetical protein
MILSRLMLWVDGDFYEVAVEVVAVVGDHLAQRANLGHRPVDNVELTAPRGRSIS